MIVRQDVNQTTEHIAKVEITEEKMQELGMKGQ